MMAPNEGAAYKNPNPCGPILRISLAKTGNRTVAEEKKVAKKSRIILEKIRGVLKTNRSPSVNPDKEKDAFVVVS